jgi:glycosyltransferase involved in cell wall biosynthesis
LKILFFPKYTTEGASSRYRTYQYLPSIRSAGFSFKVFPLFGHNYLAIKYSRGRGHLVDILQAFISRLWAVLSVPRGTIVFIEYELLPYCPPWLERWLVWRGCKIVLDYDDALFHQYDSHRSRLVRGLLGNKIKDVMRQASTLIVGNTYLADYARRACAADVEVVPTVVDLERYCLMAPRSKSAVLTIGWIGSPSTSPYLKAVAPALAAVCKDGRARLHLIGSGPIDLPDIPIKLITWCDDTEISEMCRFDVGIMPLPNEPWARGKCGFKLIQYMACGLPVVASPVGVNTEIVDNGINGYLASTIEEWIVALNQLRADVEMRHRMGLAGRKRVEDAYCLNATAPKIVDLLKKCAA